MLFLCGVATSALAGIDAGDLFGDCETHGAAHQPVETDTDAPPSTGMTHDCCASAACSTCSATAATGMVTFVRHAKEQVALSLDEAVVRSYHGSPPYKPPR
jgi:hypothetical protein